MIARLLISFAFLALPLVGFAQGSETPGTGNNQIVSRDAIGLRVVPNPERYSPLQWYNKNIKVKGAPQSLMVDGYEAVRDGRTVYVNGGKVAQVKRCINNPAIVCTADSQCGSDPGIQSFLPEGLIPTVWAAGECAVSTLPELYTNIYIISYNQDPEVATTDIFGQLLQFWKFNIDIKNCSNDPSRACTQDSECSGAGAAATPPVGVCQPTGTCTGTPDRACMIDGDCPQGDHCNSKKSTIIRDVKRLSDMRDMKDRLETYNTLRKRYPSLENGTYLTNRTVSTWPSWSTTFANTLGSPVPNDPVNALGICNTDPVENAKYEAPTCWDDTAKAFAGAANPLALPAGSRAYYYQYTSTNNSFRFCGIVESGYVQGKAPGNSICQTGQACSPSCNGKQCGDNGCGGSCGTCASGQICSNFKCVGSINQQEE